MSRFLRRGALLVAAALVTFSGWAAAVPAASAHNVLRSTTPADGAVLDTVPSRVVLTFDQPAIAMGTQIVVSGPGGSVSDGAPRLVDNNVQQDLRAGAAAGAYTVQWRVTSADGHPITGTFSFTARNAGSPGPSAVAQSSGSSDVAPSASGSSPATSPAGRVPAWTWPVIVVALLASALASVAVARRRNRRSH